MSEEQGGSTPMRDPLEEKLLNNDQTVIGIWGGTPNEVELAAHLGFDFFSIDQMFTSNGWDKTEELIRTADASGITPTIRLQSYPWRGYDRRIVTDASRNMGLGAKYIRVSYSGKQEIEDCLELAYESHRKILHLYPYQEPRDNDGLYTYIIPLAETEPSLEAMEELCSLPEIQIFGIAAGDLAPVITGDENPDFHDPKWWDFIDEVVQIGEKTNTAIASNASFHPTENNQPPYGPYTLDELEDRVVKLHNHGVKKITVQGIPFLFQLAAGELVENLKTRIDWT